METKYTVINNGSGEAIETGCTVAEAAGIILTDDGADWEIREAEYKSEPIFELWTRKQVANRPWSKTVLFSLATDRDTAEAEIFQDVVAANWPRHPYAMTDAAYAEIAAAE